MPDTKRPSFQDERRGSIRREDHEPNLKGALAGNAGTPSENNRFVTEEGLPDSPQTFLQTKAVITRKGGLVYNNNVEFVQRNS